ncbi:MAG: VWA domain-containing protein [Verrucomicrobiota bacterium]
MIFRDPAWLALLPVVALAGWVWRGLQLQRPLRAGLVLLVILLLMRPQWQRFAGGMDLWVLLDRSASTEALIDQGLPEWRQLLDRGKPGSQDRVHFVDYASEVVPQESNAGGPYTGSRTLTRTAQAVEHVLALRREDRPARVLVFTDGYSTEPLAGVAEKLARAEMPLDFRLLTAAKGDDFRLRRLQVPSRAQVSEPFLVEVEVSGPQDGPVPLTIFRNGQKLTDSAVEIKEGRGTARFTDKLAGSGSFKYEATIQPEHDAHPGNNRYESWIEITGGPRLLLVTRYQPDPLEAVLAGQGFVVETVRDPGKLQGGQLTGCRAVILNNVPAWEVPVDFLASLNFFVSAQGGGLLMAGGKKSFGAGGYFRSSIDALLPVSMELKKDQKKLAAAMVIVMDRSGSMAAPIGGGTKMDLANEGAARSIELLGYQDMAGVFAVDSEAHEVVPLQQIGSDSNREGMLGKVRRVRSEGGGIFVYNGLKAGWKVLKETVYGTRHIILFADAADAEQPEDYVKLLAEVTAEGGTVSVIALGTDMDSDAAFLKDVATRGNGRIFFTDRAEDLPNIFTAETVAVARSAFVSDPVPVAPGGLWTEIAGRPLDWMKEVDGYNLSYRRDWASQGLISQDEFAAPLVTWGQRGSGRTAAVGFPLGGDYSERIRAWPQYGDFAQTLVRWLMGQALPPGLGLRTEVKGTELALDLRYDDGPWTETFAAQAPRILLAQGARAEPGLELTWQRMAPGHYRATMELEEGVVVRGGIQAGTQVIPFGPLAAGTNAEWTFDPARQEELRQTAAASGGRELLDLAAAWQSPPLPQFRDLRPWILPLLVLLLLADALVTRLGWSFPGIRWPRAVALPGRKHSPLPGCGVAPPLTKSPESSRPVFTAEPASPGEETPPSSSPPPDPLPSGPPTDAASEEARRRARFARAKKGS